MEQATNAFALSLYDSVIVILLFSHLTSGDNTFDLF